MKHLFIINTKGKESFYLVSSPTWQKATIKLHAYLRKHQPKIWGPNPKDLIRDIRDFGSQTCYTLKNLKQLK